MKQEGEANTKAVEANQRQRERRDSGETERTISSAAMAASCHSNFVIAPRDTEDGVSGRWFSVERTTELDKPPGRTSTIRRETKSTSNENVPAMSPASPKTSPDCRSISTYDSTVNFDKWGSERGFQEMSIRWRLPAWGASMIRPGTSPKSLSTR